ncbi:hypothetical protein OROGR_015506 [Orobanche gracilis]
MVMHYPHPPDPIAIPNPFGGGRNYDISKNALETARFGTFLASWMSLVT